MLCSIALAAPVVAAQLLVGPPGTGAPFEQIQDAVLAASPGDTILVLPGTYDRFTLSKPLTVLGSGPDVTHVVAAPATPGSGIFIAPDVGVAVDVRNVGAGSLVTLSGFSVEAPLQLHDPLLDPGPLFGVTGCAGAVQLHDVEVEWSSGLGQTSSAGQVRVRDSAFVLLDAVRVDAPGGVGNTGLVVENSTLWLTNSTVRGGSVGIGGYAGVRGTDSDVLITASTVAGGDTGESVAGDCGGVWGSFHTECANPGDALILEGTSQLRVHGGVGTDIAEGVFTGSVVCDCGGHAVALNVLDTSTATILGAVTLSSSVVAAGGDLVVDTAHAPALAVVPGAAPPGAPVTALLRAEPQAAAIVYGSFPGTELKALPTPVPGVALDRATLVTLAVGSTDAGGNFAPSLALPTGPEFAGVVLAAQALVDDGGPFATSNAALVRVTF